MTPLGHAGIALLTGIGISKLAPGIDQKLIIASVTIGGTIPDIDLLYRFYQKGTKVFDKTIGEHRFFPSHTPLAVLTVSLVISLINPVVAVFFAIGALIHFFLDTLFFPEGINFLYPFSKKMTTLFTIKQYSFWAPKKIYQIDDWWKNYLTSPLFWTVEILPTLVALMLLSLNLV